MSEDKITWAGPSDGSEGVTRREFGKMVGGLAALLALPGPLREAAADWGDPIKMFVSISEEGHVDLEIGVRSLLGGVEVPYFDVNLDRYGGGPGEGPVQETITLSNLEFLQRGLMNAIRNWGSELRVHFGEDEPARYSMRSYVVSGKGVREGTPVGEATVLKISGDRIG